jgi:hypothetical protein
MVKIFLKGENVSLGVIDKESQQFLGWAGKMIPSKETIEERYRKV